MKQIFYLILSLFLLQACTLTLVQPYDEKLVDATESFYKETSQAIEQAKEVSLTHRNALVPSKLESNPGHLSHHVSLYAKAKIAANALIIRAMVNSERVNGKAMVPHKEIETLISQSLPSNCTDDKANITGNITLTLQNFLDLKCLITHWEKQHQVAPNQILKKVNWESRQVSLMGMIVSIQKAEAFKLVAKVD